MKSALQRAARKREMRYSDIKDVERGVRRHFHDDITVIVVFLDSNLVNRASMLRGPIVSLRAANVSLSGRTLAPSTTAV